MNYTIYQTILQIHTGLKLYRSQRAPEAHFTTVQPGEYTGKSLYPKAKAGTLWVGFYGLFL